MGWVSKDTGNTNNMVLECNGYDIRSPQMFLAMQTSLCAGKTGPADCRGSLALFHSNCQGGRENDEASTIRGFGFHIHVNDGPAP